MPTAAPAEHRVARQREANLNKVREASIEVSTEPLELSFFARDVLVVARELVGAELLVDGVGGTIVETEAYTADDEASHSFRGQTAANAAMFGPPGHAYVYLIYGMYWCLNFVCVPGSAVLIRALAPTAGIAAMRARRGVELERSLCSGPGKLAQALGVSRAHNALPLDRPPFALSAGDTRPALTYTTRIGITKAVDRPWRFCLADSPYLSRRVP